MMVDAEIGLRMRAVRGHLKLSVQQIAAMVGVRDRKTWERYERGDTRPNSDVLAALVRMGVSADYLLSGNQPMMAGDVAEPPLPSDYLYELVIEAALRWYDAADLVIAPDKLAGQISRIVRLIRSRSDSINKSNDELRRDVEQILDVAREIVSHGGI